MVGHNIQVASRLTGVSIHTLRAWERRYSAVVPKRLANGRRVFTEKEIEKLKLLATLTGVGYPISDIANADIDTLKNMLEKVDGEVKQVELEEEVENKEISYKNTIQHLLMALQGYKLDIISYELHKLRASHDTRDLVFKIYLPLIQEIGMKVYRDELTIAQEHALTSILRFHLGSYVYRSKQGPKKKSKKIVFATPEGDLHELGILLSSVLASYYGFEFYMLGPNLPAMSLLETLRSLDIDVIIMGTTDSPRGPKYEDFNEYFSTLMEGLKPGQELWVGGTGKFAMADFKILSNFKYIESLEQLDIKLRSV